LMSCVERIEFDAPPASLLTIVEGSISDSPGPYIVRISRGLALAENSTSTIPLKNAKIKLFDDNGNLEDFKEISPGVYQTVGKMIGEVNRSYHIIVETPEGKIFESEPEKLNPVGDLENIRFEFEDRTTVKKFGEVTSDVFNIYANGKAADINENYLRWRFTGTYKIVNFPELHETSTPPYTPYKNPWPCSGYIIVPGPPGSGGLLEKFDECSCCTCWADQYEAFPQVSDVQFVKNGQFNNVKVGEVAINNIVFEDKYLVLVEQMSLSKKGYDFFKLIRTQKEGASNLFQPPAGEIRGNMKSVNGSDLIVGLFWATSVKKKAIFIYPNEIPYSLPPKNLDTNPCTNYENSSTTKPAFWE
jgi:Domain of unknown function (DUF4249)